MIHELGFVAKSVWKISRKENSRWDISDYPAQYSQFSPALAERIIKMWSEENDLILDPMCGSGVRGYVAEQLNRRAIGIDCVWNRHLSVQADSRSIPLMDNSVDMVFSCPPYWNKEKYLSGNGQLSDEKTYKRFLNELAKILAECTRVLKPGKFMVLVVGDFRKNGRLYSFHSDLIQISKCTILKLYDTIIIEKYGKPYHKAKQMLEYKKMLKMHEYLLIFRKS